MTSLGLTHRKKPDGQHVGFWSYYSYAQRASVGEVLSKYVCCSHSQQKSSSSLSGQGHPLLLLESWGPRTVQPVAGRRRASMELALEVDPGLGCAALRCHLPGATGVSRPLHTPAERRVFAGVLIPQGLPCVLGWLLQRVFCVGFGVWCLRTIAKVPWPYLKEERWAESWE